MKTISTNFRETRATYLILLLFLSLFLAVPLYTQSIDKINLPNNDVSGFAGDIISADGKIFVYTSQNILVYGSNNILITSISIDDGSYYGKFAPHFFWPSKYLADNQMMTYNPDNHILYVLSPNMDIKIIDTQSATPDLVGTWDWVPINDIQTPMHGFAILKYDNIRKRLFLINNSRSSEQGSPISFHSRSVYLAIYSITPEGLGKSLMHSELNQLFDGFDYNKTIFDVEFNDIEDVTSDKYNHFYLARRYLIETCELINDGNNYNMTLVSNYPEFNLAPNQSPGCPHPAKFSKLIYIHDNDIHKVITVPYKMPVLGYEPNDDCDVVFHVVDLDNPSRNQSIIAPHKRVIDVAYMEGNNDLIMCFGDKVDFFNPLYKDDYYNHDMAVFHYNSVADTFYTELNNTSNWINSNNNERTENDDFVKLNIPLRIVKNASDPLNSFFLCKANEIVKFDFSGGTYVPDESSRYIGEGNHFYLGANLGISTYILNTAKSGFEVFTTYIHTATIQIGFHALRLCPDPINRKLYIYNDLNIHRNEVFITDLNTPSTDAIKLNHEDLLDNTAIGSIVYNPILNQILIAKNSESGGILTLDAENSTPMETQSLANIGPFVKEMLISPKGLLYVMLNSRNTDPVIKIFDAKSINYEEINTGGLSIDIFEQNDFTTYNADFCYNPYNDSAYAIITANNTTYDPYFTSKNNTSANWKVEPLRPFFRSVLINADRQQDFVLLDNIHMARQIICPSPDEIPQEYKGELIINAGFTDALIGNYLSGLLLYDCATDNVLTNTERNYNQINYSSSNQKIYGFEGKQILDESAHISNFFQTSYSPLPEEIPNPEQIGHYDGQVLNIFANQYDNKLYIQTKVDETRLGDDPMKLLVYDMDDLSILPEVDLENRGYYVELDQNAEALHYYYPTTFPYVDPYTNNIFLPNGGHSSVSVVGFEANEPLYLDPTVWNWVSFPRTKVPYPTNSVTVMTDNIQPFQVFQSDLYNLPFGEENGIEISMTYLDQTGWQTTGGLDEIYNVNGYKLSIDKDHLAERQLFLEGTVIPPNTSISEDLNTGKDNWVGYWLYETQDVFDALADYEPDLTIIRAEKWTCFKDDQIYGPEAPWVCDTKNPFVKYGEMLIIRTGVNITNFQWNHSGNPPESQSEASPEYFTFSPTDDYTPILIELDSTDLPQEIGAFIGDSCVGATVVNEGDTIVAMRTYLNAVEGDSVIFEKYYGTKSTNHKVGTYFVYNKEKGMHEKRVINPKERKGYIRVSFKTPDNSYLNEQGDFQLRVFPNPTNGVVKLEYYLDKDASVTIKVFDINGKIMQSLDIKKAKGKHNTTIDLATPFGNKPNPGIYLLQLSTGRETVIQKIVVE